MTQIEPQLTPDEIRQKERQRQLNRFNRLTIYLPLALMAIIILALVGLMLWRTLDSGQDNMADWRLFSSASADLIIILTILPLILLSAIFPALAAGWIWYTWGNRYPVEKWLQGYMRKADSLIVNSSGKIDGVAKKAADASITYRASTTKIGRIVEKSFGWLFTSQKNSQNKV